MTVAAARMGPRPRGRMKIPRRLYPDSYDGCPPSVSPSECVARSRSSGRHDSGSQQAFWRERDQLAIRNPYPSLRRRLGGAAHSSTGRCDQARCTVRSSRRDLYDPPLSAVPASVLNVISPSWEKRSDTVGTACRTPERACARCRHSPRYPRVLPRCQSAQAELHAAPNLPAKPPENSLAAAACSSPRVAG